MLEDGELSAVFSEVKADLHSEWERSDCAVERDELWRMVRSLDRVREKIAGMEHAR